MKTKPHHRPAVETRRLGDLLPHPSQSAFFDEPTPEEVAALADDIRRNGLRERIEVMPAGDRTGLAGNTILSGHSRKKKPWSGWAWPRPNGSGGGCSTRHHLTIGAQLVAPMGRLHDNVATRSLLMIRIDQLQCHRATGTLTLPLKCHGGKNYLAPKIVDLMPPHKHYVEAYAGGLAVLLAKNPDGVSEVVNDLHGNLMTFWRVLQDTTTFKKFGRIVQATPFSEVEWEEADNGLRNATDADPVQRAVWFFIACRQSLAGRMTDFATLSRTRTRRGMNEQASAWLNAIEGLPAVHERLQRVTILNRPALKVIDQQDGPDTLFYLDPPYLHQTRTSRKAYAHEMTEADHKELLDVVRKCKGKVMLSGYPSKLYDRALADWDRHTFDLPNNAAGGKTKRRETEVLWCNFAAAAHCDKRSKGNRK